MKEIFPEFFINKKDINFHEMDESILVVLDTNVLLDLYRGSEKLKNELTKSIELIRDNLWMPYQVGFEFNHNRKSIIHSIDEDKKMFAKNLEEKLNETIREATDKFSKKYKLFEEIIEENDAKFKKIKEEISSNLNEVDKKIRVVKEEEQLNFVEKIFSGKIADNSLYDYKEWELEGKERYQIKKPPGYEDYKQKSEEFYFIKGQRVCAAYGDFFLWKEILLKAKDEGIKEVIFITKDVKKDWFY